MTIEDVFQDKTIKAKGKVATIGEWLINNELPVDELLAYAEPRVKWESAKVIGNIAKCFPDRLEQAIDNLLLNAANTGTVVRWATAYAVAEILKLKQHIMKNCCRKWTRFVNRTQIMG